MVRLTELSRGKRKALIGVVPLYFLLALVPARAGEGKTPIQRLAVKHYQTSPLPRKTQNDFSTLGDGKANDRFASGLLWVFPGKSSLHGKVTLQMELTAPSRLSQIRVHCVHDDFSAGVAVPEWVEFQCSLDGKTWRKLGRDLQPAADKTKKRYGRWYTWQVDSVSPLARFIRVVTVPVLRSEPVYVSINEVEIFGKTAVDISPVTAKKRSAELIVNRVINGSFEQHDVLDAPNFWNPNLAWLDPRYRNRVRMYCDTTEAYHGKVSLCLDTTREPVDFPMVLFRVWQYRIMASRQGEPFTLSFYAKALKPGARLGLQFDHAQAEFSLKTAWTRYTYTGVFGTPPKGNRYHLFIQLKPTKKRHPQTKVPLGQAGQKIWLDAVQIEQGKIAHEYQENEIDLAAFDVAEAERVLPNLTVQRIADGTMNIDGVFSEACYNRPPQFKHLHGLDSPDLVREGTELYLFRDSQNIYLSGRMRFSPDKPPRVTASGQDANVFSDQSVELFLQPDENRKQYFQIALNAGEGIWDAWFTYGDRRVADKTWTAPFPRAVRLDKDEWRFEMAIPLKWLLPRMGSGTPRFNLCRDDTTWAPVRLRFHDPESFGFLRGLEDLLRAKPVKIGVPNVSYDLTSSRYTLTVPLVNTGTSPLEIAATVSLRAARKNLPAVALPVAKMTLAAGKQSSLSIPLAGERSDLYFAEIDIRTAAGEALGMRSTQILFMPPLQLRVNRLVFVGEPLRVTSRYFGSGACPRTRVILRQRNGRIIQSRTVQPVNEVIATLPTDTLAPGAYILSVTLLDKENKPLYYTKNPLYIAAERPASWSRINAHTKALEVNGRAVFLYASYYAAIDALPLLKQAHFNATMIRLAPQEDIQQIREFLDTAQRENIIVFLDLTAWLLKKSLTKKEFFGDLETLLKAVGNHPAYAGTHLFDEPNNPRAHSPSRQDLHRIRAFLAEKDPMHISWFVLGGVLTYRYAFSATDVIAYDKYAIATGPRTRDLRENYFPAQVAMEAARYYDRPMWRCLAGNEGSNPNGVRWPTTAEWRAQVFSSLAVGAKGLWLWSGYPTYDSIFNARAAIRKDLSVIGARFLTDKKAPGITLKIPHNLVWRAVYENDRYTLVAVNLDYREIEVRFQMAKEVQSFRQLLSDHQAEVKINGRELRARLSPYGVLAAEWQPPSAASLENKK